MNSSNELQVGFVVVRAVTTLLIEKKMIFFLFYKKLRSLADFHANSDFFANSCVVNETESRKKAIIKILLRGFVNSLCIVRLFSFIYFFFFTTMRPTAAFII